MSSYHSFEAQTANNTLVIINSTVFKICNYVYMLVSSAVSYTNTVFMVKWSMCRYCGRLQM